MCVILQPECCDLHEPLSHKQDSESILKALRYAYAAKSADYFQRSAEVDHVHLAPSLSRSKNCTSKASDQKV